MLVLQIPSFVTIVDFLAQVGVDPGPNGTKPDSPLSAATDTPEWQQMSSDYPIGFAVYSEVILSEYTGTLASLNSGELNISVESDGSLLTLLTVDLPGDPPLVAAIPTAKNPSELQSVGVGLQSKLLSVIVNCQVITSVWLANVPASFNFSTVEALIPVTTVS